MCTLIVAFRQHRDWPLVAAANRDELRARPASGPRRWPQEPFVAPRDEEGLGTWVGLSVTGLFVGVTNRFPAEKHAGRRSRGLLVVDALRAPDAVSLNHTLSTLDPGAYNAFHLFFADAEHAFLTWSDGARLHQLALPPGLHVVTERSHGADEGARGSLVRRLWPQVSPHGALPTPDALSRLLATRDEGSPLDGLCVDGLGGAYGTRSAMVFFRHTQLLRSRVFWTDGRPDETPLRERPELVDALRR